HLVLLQGYLRTGGIVLIGASWSLTTEAHFYLVMPWLAAFLFGSPARRGTPAHPFFRGLLLCGVVWAVRALLHEAVLTPGVVTPWLETTQRHWIVCRLDQFLLGMIAAAAWKLRGKSAIPMSAFAAGLVIAFRLDGQYYLQPLGSWPYAMISVLTAG